MIPIYHTAVATERQKVEALLRRLRLDPIELATGGGQFAKEAAETQKVIADVAKRGDAALVDIAKEFDDPNFTQAQIRVPTSELEQAVGRVPQPQIIALRRAIHNVREYQTHFLPKSPASLLRDGATLGMKFTPLDSVGIYFPGGKAAYPSTLVMLAVPAQVAGVQRIVVCTPPSRFGRSDLVLAACHELGLKDVFMVGGAAAIAAMAFGTNTIPAVDKVVGPGNRHSQLAKRAIFGGVGADGFLGPSEILVIADETGNPQYIAADLLAQAEHDPGSCFLLTNSDPLAAAVVKEIGKQIKSLSRAKAIEKALKEYSGIVVGPTLGAMIDLANYFACEHVSLQTKENEALLGKLKHAGAVFMGPFSPVAAGDYVAGPSHCLPTNTTARFSSGVSVYEFLKRTSVVKYDAEGLARDQSTIVALAAAEGLDAHAVSAKIRKTE
ncbi:MAG TPA: histidinol dehydrogenase [Tepidisphaeraceae bacterium]|nr:histidinol dehydrogenase [Tepidisphaeraceae bacterium]